MAALLIFWISLGLLAWSYAGYGIFLFLLNHAARLFRGAGIKTVTTYPPVTLIISAYNEAGILEQKIRNTAAIQYPNGLLTVIFITDGSTDISATLISNYPAFTLLHQPERKGKYAAIKRAMKEVKTPFVVFSDANTMLNPECISNVMAHYRNKNTGGVAGEKKIRQSKPVEALGELEGLYWTYESFFKKQDAAFHTVVGAAGELFSIRTELFRPLSDEVILDDFVISMQVCLQGYRIAYEPGAFATESPSASLPEEEKRKVRIAAGAYQSAVLLKGCLNIFRHPLLAFQYISRRVIRWFLSPFLLPLILATNIIIAVSPGSLMIYKMAVGGQILFYAMSLAGWWRVKHRKPAWLFTIPFYFVFMNYCQLKGLFRYFRGHHTVLWEKSLRQAVEQAP